MTKPAPPARVFCYPDTEEAEFKGLMQGNIDVETSDTFDMKRGSKSIHACKKNNPWRAMHCSPRIKLLHFHLTQVRKTVIDQH